MDAITGAEPKQCDGAPVAEGGPYCYRSAPPWAGAALPGRGPVARLRPVAADCCSPHSSLTALPPARLHRCQRCPARSLTTPPRYTSGSRGRAGALRGAGPPPVLVNAVPRANRKVAVPLPVRFDPHSLCPLFALPPAHLRFVSLLPAAPRSAVSGGVGRSGFALHAAAPHRFPGPAACPSPHRSHRPDLHRVPPVPVSAPVLRCRTGAASRLRCCSVRCGCAAGSEFIRGAFRNQNNSSSASEGPLVEVGQSVLGPNPHSIHLTLEPK